jgi:hypothetical protein
MTNLRGPARCCLPFLVLAGCGVGGQPALQVGEESAPLVTSNGHQQNGHQQNGHQQNGPDLQMAGADLTTMRRLVVVPPPGENPDLSPGNLVPVAGVKLVGSMLTDGYSSGTQFAGYVVDGTITNGVSTEHATFYIEKVAVSPTDPEIYRYQIKTFHTSVPVNRKAFLGGIDVRPKAWDYGCGTLTRRVHNPDGSITTVEVPYQATAVGGQWNYQEGVPGGGRKVIEQGNPDYDTKITFACETGAIGKCVERMGYKPWAPAATECKQICIKIPFGSPLCRKQCTTPTRELLHEACVRMVRADYCGDGTSHTVDGVSIDVWDYAGFDAMTPISVAPDGYGHEGEWTPNGARCLSDALMGRISSDVDHQPVVDYLHAHCGDKWNGQPNQPPGVDFVWELNDCFGHGPSSQHSTWDYANVPAGFDWHDRVLIKNTSMCVVDRDRTNTYMTTPPCLE